MTADISFQDGSGGLNDWRHGAIFPFIAHGLVLHNIAELTSLDLLTPVDPVRGAAGFLTDLNSMGALTKPKVTVIKGLLSLNDMGGRRRLLDRRRARALPYLPERRRCDRRTGFDRRGIVNCSIRKKFERRGAFSALVEARVAQV